MKNARKNQLNSSLATFLAFAGIVSGCAAPTKHADSRATPFSDPTRFESLASGPLSAPHAAPHAQPPTTFAATLPDEVPVTQPAEVATPLTADDAFAAIQQGNARYISGAPRSGRKPASIPVAAEAQRKAHTVVLSCSDSDVSAENVFDQSSSEIVSVRVAGHALGSAQVASIEHAIGVLGARLVVILGHESCDAVKLAFTRKGEQAAVSSQDLSWLVTSIRPNLGADRSLASVEMLTDSKYRRPAMANVDAVAEQLVVRSKLISEAVSRGTVRVVRGVHSIDSGVVEFWNAKHSK